MRKSKQLLAMFVLALFMLTSCGSSMESDAQKIADLQCKAQKLMGDSDALEKSQELIKEIGTISETMVKKYSSAEDQQKFAALVAKAVSDCD